MNDGADVRVSNNEGAGRYEVHLDGTLAGYAEYELRDSTIVFSHTVTLPEFGGRGVASAVAAFSLGDARRRGLRVVPVCSFYVEYLRRHPEYADLLQG